MPQQTVETVVNETEEETLPGNANKENLTEEEIAVIEYASRNVDATLDDLAENFEFSEWKVQNILSNKVPTWYEHTFKVSGKSLNSDAVKPPVFDTENELIGEVTKEDILNLIEEEGSIYASRLAELSEIEHPSASKKLSRLEEEGVLESDYGYDDEVGAPIRSYTLSQTTNSEDQSTKTQNQTSNNVQQSTNSVPTEFVVKVEAWCEMASHYGVSQSLSEEVEEIIESDIPNHEKKSVIHHLAKFESKERNSTLSWLILNKLD